MVEICARWCPLHYGNLRLFGSQEEVVQNRECASSIFREAFAPWVATLMSASVAVIGLFVAAYKIIEHRFSDAAATRMLLVVAILGVSSYGLVHLYTGINARPKSGVESFLAETQEYRSRALINAFGSLVIVLFLVYLVIAWPS